MNAWHENRMWLIPDMEHAESHFYDGTGHVALLTPATSADATARTLAFLSSALR